MKTDATNPAHWFMFGEERLRAADALFPSFEATPPVVELLQKSVERYLKGYLIARGWPLQKIQNLAILLDYAVRFDPRFDAFSDLCEELTSRFWNQHYPGADFTDVGSNYGDMRRQAGELIALILASVPLAGE
jgi:hypothetical protein